MKLDSVFLKFQQLVRDDPYPAIRERRRTLRALKGMLQAHANELANAVSSDFSHRAYHETVFMEVFPAIKAINYCLRHLKAWTASRKRRVSWLLQPACASVFPQPVGIVGIMVPWNYPIYLTMVPLAYAIAAGNRVMIKLSELTPYTNSRLQTLISRAGIQDNLIHIVEGDVNVARQFASLAFGHLLFTGSTAIGKQVMEAASKNLTPVTLELGGKSPVVLSVTTNLNYLNRLFMGKLINAGQTCIAPDYLLVPKGWENQIEASFSAFINIHYGDLLSNPDYSAVITRGHQERLSRLLDDAREKGARIVQFGQATKEDRKMPVSLIFDVKQSMHLMQEEIFGPLLPVLTYDSISEAIEVINSMSAPLVIYYFGEDLAEKQLLQVRTRSGGLTQNDTLTQVAVDDLPFGGVGLSGFGQYHAQEGFDRFSKLKPIFVQRRVAPITWFYPPYGKLMRYFLALVAGISSEK